MDLEPLKIDRKAPVRKTRSGRRPAWVTPLLLVIVLGGLYALFQAPVHGFIDRMRLPEVRTMRVVKSSPVAAASATGASANGYIVAKTRAALSADTPGRIVEMNVQEGSVVKRGDIVARLYSDEHAAFLRRTEAELALAEAGLTRVKAEIVNAVNDLARLRSMQQAAETDVGQFQALHELAVMNHDRAVRLLEGAVGTTERRDSTKSELDAAAARLASAKAQVETAKVAVAQGESQVAVVESALAEALARLEVGRAARDQARATLEKTEVRAPFDGIVVLKDAEVGEVVSPNSQGGTSARGSVVTMVDFRSLEVQAEVPETSLAAVVIGRPAEIFLDAYPDRPYRGRVDRIWPVANRTKATVEVRVAFEELDDRLRPEMGVRVVFTSPEAPAREAAPAEPAQPVVLVPVDSVVRMNGKSGVFVLERDRVLFRVVALGDERGGRVVVNEGLTDGETIVLSPPASLKDQDRVRTQGGRS